jgi:predicted secreted protein
MSWFTGIMAYVIIWWMVLFAILPWGNRPSENPEEGHATSAPAKPRLLVKFGVTTIVATMVFLAFVWLIESDLIALRNVD